MIEVFKLQKPLFGTGADANGKKFVLAYNKSRRLIVQMPCTKEEISKIFKDKNKIYVKGKFVPGERGSKMIEIIEKIEDQDW